MSALNTVLAFNVTLWTVATGWPNTLSTRLFLFEILENDVIWGDILNFGIKIVASAVPESARIVLQEMDKAIPDNGRKRPEMDSGGEVVKPKKKKSSKTKKAKCRTAVTYNALHVLVHVVSKHHNQSDALEFGQAVVACAIRCQAFSIILTMIDIVNDSLFNDHDTSRYYFIQDSLILCLDKIAGFKETLAFDIAIYREWQKVIKHIDLISYKSGLPTVGDMKPIKKRIEQYLDLSCDSDSLTDRVHHLLGISKHSDHSIDDIHVMQTKCENALKQLFQGISISTMQKTHWDLYMNHVYKNKQVAVNNNQDNFKRIPIF